jgi:hypothetical protein
MKNSPFTRQGTRVTWDERPGDRYIVTGIDRSGRRFRKEFSSWFFASCTNVWRGTKWLLRDGKRWRIKSVSN